MRTEDKCVLCYGDVGQAYNSNFEMSENDDERANVVSFNLFLFNTTVNLYKLRKSPSVTLLIQ